MIDYNADSTPAVPTLLLAHRPRAHPPAADRALMREKLGRWGLPSGGEVDLYLVDGRQLVCEWPQLPMSGPDYRYYVRVIAPAIGDRLMTHLGLEGNGLWVFL